MIQSNRSIAKNDIDELDLAARVTIEAQITDARAKAIPFESFASLDTSFEHYATRYAWRQYLFQFLGPLEGKTLLDVACGYSMTPVIFALAGAQVRAIDVGPETVATVQRFAEYKGVANQVRLDVAPAESLPFEDEAFDLIYGGAALHHFQLDRAGPELARVLKPGGKAAFQDPLGHNLLLEFARDYIPYPGKHPMKGTDRPLRIDQIEAFGRNFTTCTYRGFELLSMASKWLHLKRTSRLRAALEAADNAIFNTAPYLQRYARFVVTCVTKSG